MAENNVRILKVCLFTTNVIKSHVKLHVKSNATKIPRESTPYITIFTARSRIFLPAAILHVALSWPPHKPTVFARLARWQLILGYSCKKSNSVCDCRLEDCSNMPSKLSFSLNFKSSQNLGAVDFKVSFQSRLTLLTQFSSSL